MKFHQKHLLKVSIRLLVLVLILGTVSQSPFVEAQRKLELIQNPDGSFKINGVHYKNIEEVRKKHPQVAKQLEKILKEQGNDAVGKRRPGKTVVLKPSDNPPTDEARRATGKLLLKKLNSEVSKGLKHPSGKNAEVVTYSIAGLAYLAYGAQPRRGIEGRNLSKCLSFVIRDAGKQNASEIKKGFDQTTWGLSHALIFLTHYYAIYPEARVKGAINRIIKDIEGRQTEAGAWLHGKANRPNPLGYTVLNATGLLCMTGLGQAKQLGFKVSDQVEERAFKYLALTINKHGGVGYSAHPWQRGMGEAGRTAGAIQVYLRWGKEKDPTFKRLTNFYTKTLGMLEVSHASPPLHHLYGALASWSLGDQAWLDYWKIYGEPLSKRVQKDGMIYFPGQEWYEGEDRVIATAAMIFWVPEGNLTLLRHESKDARQE